MKIDKIASSVANYINKSSRTQKLLRKVSDNPALYGTISAFVVGTTIRPALTIGISKDKTDGMYSASSSITSSLVELVGGFILFNPMKKWIEKSSKDLYNSKDTFYYQNKEVLRNYKSIAGRVYKNFTLPLTSSVRFAMVPVIALVLSKLGLAKKRGINESK